MDNYKMDDVVFGMDGAAAYLTTVMGRPADRPYKIETVKYHVYKTGRLQPRTVKDTERGKHEMVYFVKAELDEFARTVPKPGFPKGKQRKPATVADLRE